MKEQCRKWKSPLPERKLQSAMTQLSAMAESLNRAANDAAENSVRLRYDLHKDHYVVTWLREDEAYPTGKELKTGQVWCSKSVWIRWNVDRYPTYRVWEAMAFEFWQKWEQRYGKYGSSNAGESKIAGQDDGKAEAKLFAGNSSKA